MSQFKERMQSSGWGFLSVLMLILGYACIIMPLSILEAPWWVYVLLILLITIFKDLAGLVTLILMPWGLVAAINGPQNTLTTVYYIFFGIWCLSCIPYIIFSIISFFNNRKEKQNTTYEQKPELKLTAETPKQPASPPASDIPRMPKAAFAPRNEIVCASCGNPLSKGAKFCTYCGHALQEQNIAHFANTILPKEKSLKDIISECSQKINEFTHAVAQAGYKIIHENAPAQFKACAITVYANISEENRDAADKFIHQQSDPQLISAYQFYQKYYAAALSGEVKAPDNPIYSNKRWPLLFISALLIRECCGPLREEDEYIAANDLLVKNTARLIEALL